MTERLLLSSNGTVKGENTLGKRKIAYDTINTVNERIRGSVVFVLTGNPFLIQFIKS